MKIGKYDSSAYCCIYIYILVISYKNISSASRIGLTILNGDMIFIEDGEIVEKKYNYLYLTTVLKLRISVFKKYFSYTCKWISNM